MVFVGALIAFVSMLGRVAHSALGGALFVGATVTCYYATQTDFVGAFNHAYGFKMVVARCARRVAGGDGAALAARRTTWPDRGG